jgi:hypothetical protein
MTIHSRKGIRSVLFILVTQDENDCPSTSIAFTYKHGIDIKNVETRTACESIRIVFGTALREGPAFGPFLSSRHRVA